MADTMLGELGDPTTAGLLVDTAISDEVKKAWISEAEHGSELYQLQLGLLFLKLAESNIDKEENAAKAVEWFVAASKQGNEIATKKLKHCVQTATGITDENKSDVKWCLTTSAHDKKICCAARSFFSQLTKSRKGELSKEEYKEAVRSFTVGHERERRLLLAAGTKMGSVVSENDFVKTLSSYIQGILPLTPNMLDKTTAAYDSAGIIEKVFIYPRQTASIAFDRMMEYASKEGASMMHSLIPTNQIYLLAVLFVYSFLTPGFFFLMIPLVAFYISILVMVITTLQMFHKQHHQKDAIALAKLLQREHIFDLESAESQYSWNSLTPYFVFFLSLPIIVVSLALANKAYIPCAELFVLSMVMAGLSFLGLCNSYDHLTLVALGAHVFASFPIFFSNIPKIPFFSQMLDFITNPFFSAYLGLGISYNLSIPAVIQMIIPIILFRMAMRGSWTGIYKILVPHLVCYFWFNVATTVFPFTTWIGLTRATLGYLLLPLFVPLSLPLTVFGIFYFFNLLLRTEFAGKLVVTIILLGVSVFLTQTETFFGKKTSPKAQKIKKAITIILAILGIFPLLFINIPSLVEKKSLDLSWEDYKELCIPKDGIMAPYQLRCRDFMGAKIHWKGVVQEVKITKVDNTAESVIRAFPGIISEPLSCIYGEKIPECDKDSMTEIALKHCQLVKLTERACYLNSYNQLTFSLNVMVDGIILSLEAGNNFKDVVMALLAGDMLEFSGKLTDVGTKNPSLKLKSMNCLNRELPALVEIENDVDKDDIMKILNEAVALIFNFILFPVFKYSPEA